MNCKFVFALIFSTQVSDTQHPSYMGWGARTGRRTVWPKKNLHIKMMDSDKNLAKSKWHACM